MAALAKRLFRDENRGSIEAARRAHDADIDRTSLFRDENRGSIEAAVHVSAASPAATVSYSAMKIAAPLKHIREALGVRAEVAVIPR